MNDVDLDSLIKELGHHQRRKVVRALLVGNDAQCFTTEQYVAAYHRIAHKDDPEHKAGWLKWLTKLTPDHMESVGMVEVRPGVWARPMGV